MFTRTGFHSAQGKERERKHGFGFLVEQECFGMPKGRCLRVSGQSGGSDIVSSSLAVICPFGG